MIPSEKQCLKILKKQNLPENIIKHSKTVAKVALEIAEKLKKKGIKVNIPLVRAAALLHDIARTEPDHVIKGERLLKKLGMDEVAEVVKTHGLYHLSKFPPKTIEQKIVFYADKRVNNYKIVTVEERFRDFKKRYNKTQEEIKQEYEFVKNIEKELFK